MKKEKKVEFQVQTALINAQPREIQSNVAEVETWLRQNLTRYEQMVVEEAEIPSAKADLAQIRKIKKTISDQRIFVKKEFLIPYTEWEEKVKVLEGLCDSAADNIDKQVKMFDQQKKEAKLAEIREYFDSLAKSSQIEEFLTFEQISNPKWANETYKMNTIMQEVKSAVSDTVEDIRTIYNQNSDFETALLDEYKQCHDLRKVLAKNSYLYDLREREASRRNSTPPAPVDDSEAKGDVSAEEQKKPSLSEPTMPKPIKRYNVLLSLEMTAQQMRNLDAYLKINKITVLQSKSKEITKK